MPLTDSAIKGLKSKEKRYKVFDLNGLHLEVQPSGAKVWRLRYTFGGKEKRSTIGRYPDVTLKEARDKAADALKILRGGADPFEKKVHAPLAGGDFKTVALDWIEKQAPRWADAHRNTVRRRLELYAFAHIGDKSIKDITPPEVLRLVRLIEGNKKNETASRVLGICSQVFRYAVACGVADSDPCRDLRGALTAHVETPRPALTDPKEVGSLMASIRVYKGSTVTRFAMLWSAYTFCRPGEVRRAEWTEIDWEKEEWRIPAEKMKMRFEHRVPLARQCITILESLRERKLSAVWIFPGPRPL